MEHILDNRFVPLTFSIGFLETPLGVAADAYLQWTRRNYRSVDASPTEGGLVNALKELEPLTTPPRRGLLLFTDSQWTAYFDNGTRGPDPRTPVSYLSEQLHCRGLVATCVPHTLNAETGNARGTYGAVHFELFAPTKRQFLNYERSISVAYEAGKWRFDVSGDVQPFEEPSRYSARKIRDRFTPAMLLEYCMGLGVRLFDDQFYRGPGLLVLIRDALPAGAKEISLARAQEELGAHSD
jgi:hypothetical protein